MTGFWAHSSGKCLPCRFMFTKRGCDAGDACTFCHLEHPRSRRLAKPSKLKRSRDKKYSEARFANPSTQDDDQSAEAIKETQPTSACETKLEAQDAPQLLSDAAQSSKPSTNDKNT